MILPYSLLGDMLTLKLRLLRFGIWGSVGDEVEGASVYRLCLLDRVDVD